MKNHIAKSRSTEQHQRDVGDGKVTLSKDPQRYQWITRDLPLVDQEACDEDYANADRHIRWPREPALDAGTHDAIDDGAQAERDGDRTGKVEAAARRTLVTRLGNEAPDGRRQRDADRHIDQKDPRPREQVGERTAREHADGAASATHGAPHAERPVTGRALAERGAKNRERRRRHDRATDPLQRTRGDQHALRLSQPADQ